MRTVLALLLLALLRPAGRAQTAPHTGAPRPLQTFDIIAVHQHSSSGADPASSMQSNVPLGPGDIFTPTGGVLSVRNAHLITLVAFAFRLSDAQLNDLRAHVPDWVLTDRFDVEARTDDRTAGKNTLRLMMQSLLAERFGLQVHHEQRQSTVFALLLLKPGTLGPRLRLHPASEGCSTAIPGPNPKAPDVIETVPGGYPAICGGIVQLDGNAPGQILIGGRAVSLQLLVNSLASWGQLDRPILDRTGLTGNIDFLLQYSPQPAPDAPDSTPGPGFAEALKQQLGLRLQSEKTPVDFLVLDKVDHPTAN